MADRPILFSALMVRAILREIEQPGTGKTQTRRVLTPQPHPDMGFIGLCAPKPTAVFGYPTPDADLKVPLRFMQGDHLWVREAWAPLDALTHSDPGATALANRGLYRADDGTVDGEISRWRSSIHMPRWASRITLVVTDVRVERLQDITDAEAKAEGCGLSQEQVANNADLALRPPPVHGDFWYQYTARGNFLKLWCEIHGGIDAWDANPWVAACTFRPILGNIDQVKP